MCGTTPHHWRGVPIPWWTDDADGLARRDRAHRVGRGHITPEPVAVQRFCARATRKSFPISSHRALQAYTVWLRREAQMVSPARRTECVSFDNSRVLCAWICLLLQSAQPRLASANLERVILALCSVPGTIGQNFLRLRRAAALHLSLQLSIHRGPGPPLSREVAGFDTRSVAHVCR